MNLETRLEIYDEILLGLKKTELFNINDVIEAIPEDRSDLFTDKKDIVEFVVQFLSLGNTTLYMEYEGHEITTEYVLDLLMNEKEFVNPQTGLADQKWAEKTFMFYSLNDYYIERREILLKEREMHEK